MGDLVTCKAVLSKPTDPTRETRLFLAVPPDWLPRIITCRPKGTPRQGTPEWEYEERDGRLHLTPSLLCLDTNFHTDYHWSCDYEILQEGEGSYDYFYKINPGITMV